MNAKFSPFLYTFLLTLVVPRSATATEGYSSHVFGSLSSSQTIIVNNDTFELLHLPCYSSNYFSNDNHEDKKKKDDEIDRPSVLCSGFCCLEKRKWVVEQKIRGNLQHPLSA